MSDPQPFLIGGEWRTSDNVLDVHFPYTNEVIARVCQATEQDLEDAVVAAQRGLKSPASCPPMPARKFCTTCSTRWKNGRTNWFTRW